MTRTISSIALGYSVLAGPLVWFAHFIAVYTLAEFGCRANFANLLFVSASDMRIVIFALTVPALLAVAFGGLLAYRNWQLLHQPESPSTVNGGQTDFLIVLGFWFSALFFLSILFTVAPTFILNACDKAI